MVKNPPANSGDAGSIPGSGKYLGEGNNNPLQYSCLGNHMDRGAWWAAVHEVTKSWAWLRDNTHASTSEMILTKFQKSIHRRKLALLYHFT